MIASAVRWLLRCRDKASQIGWITKPSLIWAVAWLLQTDVQLDMRVASHPCQHPSQHTFCCRKCSKQDRSQSPVRLLNMWIHCIYTECIENTKVESHCVYCVQGQATIDEYERTCLARVAAQHGQAQCSQLLLTLGLREDRDVISSAASAGHLPCLRLAHEQGQYWPCGVLPKMISQGRRPPIPWIFYMFRDWEAGEKA
jgi:hypothetical protein